MLVTSRNGLFDGCVIFLTFQKKDRHNSSGNNSEKNGKERNCDMPSSNYSSSRCKGVQNLRTIVP